MSAAVILGLIFYPAPWLWGSLGLLAAVHILLHALGLSLSGGELFLVSALLLAVPLAAWLSGRLLDRFAFTGAQAACFSSLGAALAFSLLIESGLVAGTLKALLQVLTLGSWERQLLLAGAIGNAVVFCAGLAALVVMLLVLVVELPFNWFCRVDAGGAAGSMAVLRPLLVVLVLCLVFNHAAGLFFDELSPMMLFSGAVNG